MNIAQPSTSPALSMRGIRKAFPGVVAVEGVDLDVFPGEIRALVGENGAGKSTLAAIASGELPSDAGSVERHGAVGLVHQHFELVGRLRVWQNVVLGREPRKGLRIDRAAARTLVERLAGSNGLDVDPDAYVDELPVGVQQRVELLRELSREPQVLLLDEPTAALAPAEVDALFSTIAALARRGTAILIVTHKLQEVMSFAHRVCVMRRGRIVLETDASSTSISALARAMVGGDLPSVAERIARPLEPCVQMRDVSTTGDAPLNGISLDVRRGEIVGVAGVEGNGQSALADVLAGVECYSGELDVPATRGIVPQDRRREGLVLNWSVAENVMLGRQHRLRKGVSLDMARARADAARIVAEYDVRTPSIDTPAGSLSGGNQQKIVVGRALIDEPAFVLAYNATRGIDVGAAAVVQSRLIEARNRGAAVLLISFDLDEILNLADRIVVLYRGRIAGSFDRAAVDRGIVGRLMAGGREGR